jgi:cell division inhibitor SepF
MSFSAKYEEDVMQSSGAEVLCQFVLVEPTGLEDADMIADHVKEHKSVLLNTETLDAAVEVRILDYLRGFVYACDGSITRLADGLILVAPNGVDVSGQIADFLDK